MIKYERYYNDVKKVKDRLNKPLPNMPPVIRSDIERLKVNKVYDRRLNQNLTGARGLHWQCNQESQRLRSDEHDLIRLNRDLVKITSFPSISQSSSIHQSKDLSRNHTPRLSSIIEENDSSLPMIEKSKINPGRLSSLSPSRASSNYPTSVQNRLLAIRQNKSHNEHFNWLCKHSFQQAIAKTSDEHSYLQKHAHIINQQKRSVDQILQQFLHEIK